MTTGVCAGGAAPKSTQIASNGDVYAVCAGNDFYGGDLAAPYNTATVYSLNDCMNACSNTPKCIAAAYVPGTCYLKNVQNAASFHDGEDTFYNISSGSKVSQDQGAEKSTNSSQAVKCKKVTAGFMCPEDEMYYHKKKNMCNRKSFGSL